LERNSLNIASEDDFWCCKEEAWCYLNFCEGNQHALDLDFDIVTVNSDMTAFSYSADGTGTSSSSDYTHGSSSEESYLHNEYFRDSFQRVLQNLFNHEVEEDETDDETSDFLEQKQSLTLGKKIKERIRSLPKPMGRKKPDLSIILEDDEDKSNDRENKAPLSPSFRFWKTSHDNLEEKNNVNESRGTEEDKYEKNSSILPLNYSQYLWGERKVLRTEESEKTKRRGFHKLRRAKKKSPPSVDENQDLIMGHFFDFWIIDNQFNSQEKKQESRRSFFR
jgi:hypothetical protein